MPLLEIKPSNYYYSSLYSLENKATLLPSNYYKPTLPSLKTKVTYIFLLTLNSTLATSYRSLASKLNNNLPKISAFLKREEWDAVNKLVWEKEDPHIINLLIPNKDATDYDKI